VVVAAVGDYAMLRRARRRAARRELVMLTPWPGGHRLGRAAMTYSGQFLP
jgi:hypothetical protein